MMMLRTIIPCWLTLTLSSVFLLDHAGVTGQPQTAIGETIGQTTTTIETPIYANCDLDQYYAPMFILNNDTTQWKRNGLEVLVRETHQNELPFIGATSGADDIYQAMIDLDNIPNTTWVQLVYRDQPMNATPFANPLYWDAEWLWPVERGVTRQSQAFTDIHHLKPAKATILMKKGALSFGMCDTVEYPEACVTPANSEAAPDTAYDGKIWQPPARFRGDIARALMYMDLRYAHLTLQDCGPFADAMGYTSQLLEWHMEDPPSDFEIRRNNRACSRWQGNRNPFIDYPELATAIHGEPQQIMENSRTYPSCVDIPTPSPTASPNDCSNIFEGNVPIFLVNSDDPDEVIVLPLQNLPEGLDLYLTDQAWNGVKFVEGVAGEGVVTMTTPLGGIGKGDIFGYGPQAPLQDRWTAESGEFSLGDTGDNIFLYCFDADDNIRFLSGFTNSDNWELPGLEDAAYGVEKSSLPEELAITGSHVALVHLDNYFYNGTREGSIPQLRIDIYAPEFWQGDDTGRFRVDDGSDTSSADDWSRMNGAMWAISGLVVALFL